MGSLDTSRSTEVDGNDTGKEIFSLSGVIFKSPNTTDDDFQSNGSISIVDYNTGKAVEWKPAEVSSIVAECQEQEWAMVNTVGRRSRSCSGSTDGSSWRSQCIKIPLNDLKGYRVSQKKTKLIIVLNDGTTYNAFYFQFGNSEPFTRALNAFVKTRRSRQDKNFYIVLEINDPKTFSDLGYLLNQDQSKDVVWNFVNNLKERPYETAFSTFSKVSQKASEFLLYKSPEERAEGGPAGDMLSRSSVDEGSYQLVGRDADSSPLLSLPARSLPPREQPLSPRQWAAAMDPQGRVVDVAGVKAIIFKGGCTPSLRYEVWKFLLGYFPWDSTLLERQELRKRKVEEYFTMKRQWKSMSPDQESRFTEYRDRKNHIEKDVNRTDRTIPFFAGENNPNLSLLYDILMTYIMYNFDLGYVQGMSDLLSPILSLMSNEVDAFWCFVGFMDKVNRNFDEDQSGMKKQLSQLHTLLSAAEPQLAAYLDQHDSGNMFFCFRWLLVWFKREFSHNDIMTLWEVLWTGLPCANFHLLLCVAILENEKSVLMGSDYGFTEILKHINELSCRMDLNLLLSKAEGIYKQLETADNLTVSTRRVLGLGGSGLNGSHHKDDDYDDGGSTSTEEAEDGSLLESPDTEQLRETACQRGLDLQFL